VTTAGVAEVALVDRVTVPTDEGSKVVVGAMTAGEVGTEEKVTVGYVTVGNPAVWLVEEAGGGGGGNTQVEVGVPMLIVVVAVVVVVGLVVTGGGGGGGGRTQVEDGGGGSAGGGTQVLVTGQTVVLTGIVTVVRTVL
jgi:hypothetical protein